MLPAGDRSTRTWLPTIAAIGASNMSSVFSALGMFRPLAIGVSPLALNVISKKTTVTTRKSMTLVSERLDSSNDGLRRRLSSPKFRSTWPISERAEKAAVIMTTNLPFSEWTQVIPDARLCKALLDRVTDQAHIIETRADSYRFRRTLEKRQKKKD